MRTVALALLLLTLPLTGSLTAPTINGLPDLFPEDIRDADLVYLLARNAGLPVEMQAPVPATGESIPTVLTRLAARNGALLLPTDIAAFNLLDPRIAAPVSHLLVTMEASWDMRDAAFSGLTPAEYRELEAFQRSGETDSPRYNALLEGVNLTKLVESAILLLITLEDIITPQLEEAVRTALWPPIPLTDPAVTGLLRIGTTGDDVEHDDRMVQIDPAGNDYYSNNAGSSTTLRDLDPLTPAYPNSISLDFAGDDRYVTPISRHTAAQGHGDLGVGILQDYRGDDEYDCERLCQGADLTGVALFHDHAGNDRYRSGSSATGYSGNLLGILRDDQGNDRYLVATGGGGVATSRATATGLLWDRAGADSYELVFSSIAISYGYAREGARGWLVDEGPAIDFYQTAFAPPTTAHGCNDCTWTFGASWNGRPSNGRGNDNSGGLAFMLTRQNGLEA